jgi:hypothetical protein
LTLCAEAALAIASTTTIAVTADLVNMTLSPDECGQVCYRFTLASCLIGLIDTGKMTQCGLISHANELTIGDNCHAAIAMCALLMSCRC